METGKTSIIDFLSEIRLIKLPCWHRDFIWDIAHVAQLFDDVESLINNANHIPHFFGPIVYNDLEKPILSIKLIDGQQRLITISLFFAALFDYFKNSKYKSIFLFQQNQPNNTKIIISSPMQEYYQKVLNDGDYAYSNNSQYSQVYRYLFDRIEHTKYSIKDFLDAFKRLEIVILRLDKNDNAQLIFDSVNSLSVRLTKFEKIKNYVFMGLSDAEQEEILESYWLPLSKLFEDNPDGLINYLISFVSMQTTTRIIDKDNIFTEFNKFYSYKRKYKNVSEIMSELFKFAQYYIRIQNCDFTNDIATQLSKIINITQEPAIYSFLFELVDDFQNELIAKKSFVDILETAYSYIDNAIRNNESIDFTMLSQTISKLLTSKFE